MVFSFISLDGKNQKISISRWEKIHVRYYELQEVAAICPGRWSHIQYPTLAEIASPTHCSSHAFLFRWTGREGCLPLLKWPKLLKADGLFIFILSLLTAGQQTSCNCQKHLLEPSEDRRAGGINREEPWRRAVQGSEGQPGPSLGNSQREELRNLTLERSAASRFVVCHWRKSVWFFLFPVIAREKKNSDQKSSLSLAKTKTAEGETVSWSGSV